MYFKTIHTYLLIIVLSLTSQSILSQLSNLGQPFVKNFDKKTFKGGTQSWALDYSEKGYLFVANNNGLLVYNGIDWTTHKTNNKTIIRSLTLSEKQNTVYVGGQSEFGRFKIVNNQFTYEDLSDRIPEKYRGFTDVWDMFELNEHIYFRTDNTIFDYYENNVNTIDLNGTITFLKAFDSTLLYNVVDEGIYQYNNGISKKISNKIAQYEIVDAIPINSKEHLLLTRANGIYKHNGEEYSKWKTNADKFLQDNLLNSALYFESKDYVIIGTHLGGLAIFDLNGNLQYLLDSESNLQNNTITNIISDGNDNIWVTTYNGIDQILLTSSGNRIYPDNELKGAVYDIEYWKGYIYFATANGLYTIKSEDYYDPQSNNKFQFIEGTEGECWGLDIIDNQLFVAHNIGGFQFVNNVKLQNLNIGPGVWKYIKIDENKIIYGGYKGLGILQNNANKWELDFLLEGFDESSRIMVFDKHNTLWVTHPYKGIFQVQFSNNFQDYIINKIEKDDGITNLNNCYGHELEGNFIVSNDSSVYAYDYSTFKFLRDPNLDSLFNNNRLIRLLNENGEYYYISNLTAGKLVERNIGTVNIFAKLPIIPNEESFVGGFENLKILPDNNLAACTDKGVLVSDLSSNQGQLVVRIKKIITGDKDQTIYNSFQEESMKLIELPYNNNKIDIHYSSTFSKGVFGGLKYSYRLVGADDRWSEWSTETHKEFNFLPPNDYTFEVRSLANGQQLSDITQFTFTIKPHFLLSTAAKLIYLIFALIGVLLLLFLPRRKLLKEKNKVVEKVKDLEAEKIDLELKAKNRELAYSTMHLLQKSEFINGIKSDIVEVKNLIKDPSAKKELKKVITKLQDDQRLEDDWGRFSTHFDKVHHDFFRRLKENHPKLSSKDLKLCAYLRLNLSTKEIAPLLGISVRGVEISRYRLRKKVDLDKSINLNEYMISY